MTSTHASNSSFRQMLAASVLVALLVFGMIVAQPQAVTDVSATAGAEVATLYLAQAEPLPSMTDSVNWARLPVSTDPSTTAVAAYGN